MDKQSRAGREIFYKSLEYRRKAIENICGYFSRLVLGKKPDNDV
jgi:hypothetical protein